MRATYNLFQWKGENSSSSHLTSPVSSEWSLGVFPVLLMEMKASINLERPYRYCFYEGKQQFINFVPINLGNKLDSHAIV